MSKEEVLCKGYNKKGEPCGNQPEYCIYHSLWNRLKPVTWRRIFLIYIPIIGLIGTLIATHTYFFGPTKDDQKEIRKGQVKALEEHKELFVGQKDIKENVIKAITLILTYQKDMELTNMFLQGFEPTIEHAYALISYNMTDTNTCKWIIKQILDNNINDAFALALENKVGDPNGYKMTEDIRIVEQCLNAEKEWREKGPNIDIDRKLFMIHATHNNNLYINYLIAMYKDWVIKETKSSNVYYVDAINGLDNSPGLSNMPFRTLARVFYISLPGDVIILRQGIYDLRHEGKVIHIIPYQIKDLESIKKINILQKTKNIFVLPPDVYSYLNNRLDRSDVRSIDIRIPGPIRDLHYMLDNCHDGEIWLLQPGKYTWSYWGFRSKTIFVNP